MIIKRICICVLLLAMLMPSLAVGEERNLIDDAKQIIEAILAGDVDAYYDRFTPAVQAEAPRSDMEDFAPIMEESVGKFVEYTSAQLVGMTALIGMRMERLDIVGQIAFDADGMVNGFGFVSGESLEHDTSMAENEEMVAVGPKALEGVLTMPQLVEDEKVPAVVLVHGSGAQDRNEAMGEVKIFKDIAQLLSERGIAVLRYDKRSYALQQGTFAYTDEEVMAWSTWEDTVEDAIAALALLREDTRIDENRVFILGHSQGGMLANRIHAEGGNANGLIVLAGTLRHLAEVMADQLENMDAGSGQLAKEIELAKTITGMTAEEAYTKMLIGSTGYFFWEEAQHDYVAIAEENDVPMLILQGSDDQNIFPDTDYVLWQEFMETHPDKDMELIFYQGLDHLFVIDGVFASEVADDIANWILER